MCFTVQEKTVNTSQWHKNTLINILIHTTNKTNSLTRANHSESTLNEVLSKAVDQVEISCTVLAASVLIYSIQSKYSLLTLMQCCKHLNRLENVFL